MNDVYCCDNLKLLKNLSDECINLIYCDILYGTGRKNKNYIDLKCDWTIIESFYKPRIEQMFRVLKLTGSMYLQMDWRISHWIRIILDEIFGRENFRNNLIWSYGAGDVNAKNRFRRCHDDILFYAKSKNNVFNIERNEKGIKAKDYFYMPSFSQKIYQKKYFKLQDDYIIFYYSQKPQSVIKKIILASSNENDLVADFFCGSGTTGVVCKKLNRRYLLCDNNEIAINITKERLKERTK